MPDQELPVNLLYNVVGFTFLLTFGSVLLFSLVCLITSIKLPLLRAGTETLLLVWQAFQCYYINSRFIL